jgi:hypothetical protein|tara:strand:- start:321 stop:833 length:513 start_codon:yes stop_codon:yes gene_type:complete
MYSFKEQIAKKEYRLGELLCVAYLRSLGKEIKDISGNHEGDIVEIREEGARLYEVKTDMIMSTSGNIFVELIEILTAEGIKKKGWFGKTYSYVLYLDWHNKELYIIKAHELAKVLMSESRDGKIVLHEKYVSFGVPIHKDNFKHKVELKEFYGKHERRITEQYAKEVGSK